MDAQSYMILMVLTELFKEYLEKNRPPEITDEMMSEARKKASDRVDAAVDEINKPI